MHSIKSVEGIIPNIVRDTTNVLRVLEHEIHRHLPLEGREKKFNQLKLSRDNHLDTGLISLMLMPRHNYCILNTTALTRLLVYPNKNSRNTKFASFKLT